MFAESLNAFKVDYNSKKNASPDADWNLIWHKTNLNINSTLNYYICICLLD